MTGFWLIIVWLFVLGGAVGSFLNVVVYRLPLGISLIHPPSHCPK
jgi:leader peptidase (prepilin peptidase) / N-methyltransferase